MWTAGAPTKGVSKFADLANWKISCPNCGDADDAQNDADIGFLCVAKKASDKDFVCNLRHSGNKNRVRCPLPPVACVVVRGPSFTSVFYLWFITRSFLLSPSPFSTPPLPWNLWCVDPCVASQLQCMFERNKPGADLLGSLTQLFSYPASMGLE
jgi:hypothetical protein